MSPVYCLVATTQRQLDDALRVRWAVFGEELRLLGGPVPAAPREVNCFDTLETTVHLVVYAGDTPVATSRLLLPNPEVAQRHGGHLGIALEQKLDLSGVDGPGLRVRGEHALLRPQGVAPLRGARAAAGRAVRGEPAARA